MHHPFLSFLWLVVLGWLGLGGVRADTSAVALALDLPADTAITLLGDPWIAQNTTTHDGVDAAQSDLTPNASFAQLSLVVTGPLNLSFFWKLDSAGSDISVLVFRINEVDQAYTGQYHPSGTWAQKTYSIPAGSHTLTWEHNDLEFALLSKAWLDQIVLAPVVFHSVTFDLGAYGNRTGGGELSQSVEHGTAALAPTLSVAAGWAFTGWDIAFAAVTGDLTITARYVVPTAPVLVSVSADLNLPGSSAALSVTATSNAPLDYQWYRGESGNISAPVPGATGPLLVTPALSVTTRFWARVSNAAGTLETPAGIVAITAPLGRTLRASGSTAYGFLGNGYPGYARLPVSVDADVVAMAAGGHGSLFVKADGSLWGMGNNWAGQLGINSTTNIVPAPIATGVTAVATGLTHSLFIRSDGSLWAMGDNRYGQLGDGSKTARRAPVPIASGVVAVAAGLSQSSFLKSDGSLWLMGYYGNNNGSPEQIASGVAALAAGGYQTLYLKTDGSLWAVQYPFGYSTVNSPTLLATDVSDFSTSYHHTLFVKKNGSLWAFGDNSRGQLGDGSTSDHGSPVLIANDVASVAAGDTHSLFVRTDGSAWAMGTNEVGQLGDGTTADRQIPVLVASSVAHVVAGARHTLFLHTDGSLRATGFNQQGQLGDGRAVQLEPVAVATGVTAVSASLQDALFIKTDGTLWAMGSNESGQHADGTTLRHASPIQVASGVAAVAVGDSFSLILKTDASLWITKSNYTGYPNPPPPSVNLLANGVGSVAPGLGCHTLFVRTDASLWGVGVNDDGQLGDGTRLNRATPVLITPGVATAAAGYNHSAFIRTDGTLWTVGVNDRGQLGDGTTTLRISPVLLARAVVSVAAGWSNTFFIKNDRTLWATGENRSGQLGDGTREFRSTPVWIASGVSDIAVGGSHTFFRTLDGSVWAMGDNSRGQLGDGTFTSRIVPVRIGAGFSAIAAVGPVTFWLTPSGFVAWATAAGLDDRNPAHASAPNADPDADSTPNLLEYAFGTSPTTADSTATRPSVSTATVGDQISLVLTHRRRKAAALTYTYQSSSNLADPAGWTPVAVTPVVVATDTDGDGLVETVSVSVPFPPGAEPRLFLRLSVSE